MAGIGRAGRLGRTRRSIVGRARSSGRSRSAHDTQSTLPAAVVPRIGEALAARARPFGVRVVGVKHEPARRYDAGVAVDEVLGLDALDEALPRADHVCLTVPLTDATRHLTDARRLARMRPGAFLYNVSRGAVVDQAALVAALRAGRLAGAGLDVFEEEPLPAESPLWELPNVILTPHVAGATPRYYERTAALFADNLERFLAGRSLENRFDSGRGY